VLTLIDPDGAEHALDHRDLLVPAHALAAATGWELKPEGLCRGETCVPLYGRQVAAAGEPGRVDLKAWAESLGLLLVHEPALAAVALVASAATHAAAQDGRAPALTLPDVDGNPVSFDDLSGHKRVLVTWASWCGCRHELAGWEQVQQELADDGLRIFSVALDADPEDSRPWIEAGHPSYPVAVDTAHVTAERYGITNVPSVVWVDEQDRVVKPPTIAPGDDQFADYTLIDSARHHDALRAWVRDGTLPASAEAPAERRTDDGQRALAHRRLAAYAVRTGRPEVAGDHLAAAQELAPWDWTVRRGGIAMTGGDPFLGEEFIAFWEKWDGAGRPGYTPT
jgi:peroxiredoxin